MSVLGMDEAQQATIARMAPVDSGARAALDDGWFAGEVEPHLTKLYRQAFRLTGDPQRADDLLQDTLERGYRKLALFRPGTDMRAWLVVIMRNVWISGYRRRTAEPHLVSLEALDETSVRGSAAAAATAGSVVETSVVDGLGETAIMEI